MNKKQNLKKEIDFFNSLDLERYTTFPSDKNVLNLIFKELNKINLNGQGLEAGCGTASLGIELLNYYPQITVTGVDINKRIVDYVKNRKLPRYHVLLGNLEKIAIFKPHSFDFIVFPYVLHHFPDAQLVLDDAYYWLKKNGYLIIFDPNASNLVLKCSYNLRLIFNQIFPSFIKHCASGNEKNVPLKKIFGYLDTKFKILSFKTYLIRTQAKNSLPLIINILGYSRSLLLFLNNFLAPHPYSGSDIFIVAQKTEK